MGNLSTLEKGAFLVGILAGLSFIVMAVIQFMREGDWHAHYLLAAMLILLVTVIALRRSLRRAR